MMGDVGTRMTMSDNQLVNDNFSLYQELYRGWRTAHPLMPASEVLLAVRRFWAKYFNRNKPQTKMTIMDKILELREIKVNPKGDCVSNLPRGQLTLTSMWSTTATGKAQNRNTQTSGAIDQEPSTSSSVGTKRKLHLEKPQAILEATIDDDSNEGKPSLKKDLKVGQANASDEQVPYEPLLIEVLEIQVVERNMSEAETLMLNTEEDELYGTDSGIECSSGSSICTISPIDKLELESQLSLNQENSMATSTTIKDQLKLEALDGDPMPKDIEEEEEESDTDVGEKGLIWIKKLETLTETDGEWD